LRVRPSEGEGGIEVATWGCQKMIKVFQAKVRSANFCLKVYSSKEYTHHFTAREPSVREAKYINFVKINGVGNKNPLPTISRAVKLRFTTRVSLRCAKLNT